MTTNTSEKDDEAGKLKVNEQKWSKTLMDAGWTAIPTVFIERQKAIGLDAIDINILMHLAAYWWTADNRPHPSKVTIAAAIGITPRTVQRRIAKMEAAGFIKREQRRIPGRGSRTNVYHLDGLIEAAVPLAKEKIASVEKRRSEEAARVARRSPRRPPELKVVSSKED